MAEIAARAYQAVDKATDIVGLAGKGLRKLGPVLDGAVGAVARRANKAIDKMPQWAKCLLRKEPVDLGSGVMLTVTTDVTLPGPIPFEWERVWYSRSDYEGPLGYGWHHRYDMALRLDDGFAVLRMADGRQTEFDCTTDHTGPYFDRKNRLSLHRSNQTNTQKLAPWRVWDHAQKVWYTFNAPPENGPMQPLQRVETNDGQAIELHYSAAGHLNRIVDSAGRELTMDTDGRGRITALYGPDPALPTAQLLLVAYAYDGQGNMATVTNAEGYQWQMRYEGHLMNQKTLPNGLSFYWRYDAPDHSARCVHTWGDGGIHEGRFSYPDAYTTVMTDIDGTHTYTHYDGLVTDYTDPLGRHTQTLYNGFQDIEVERDPMGNTTTYDYDQWGNLTAMTHADGASEAWAYDPTGERLMTSSDARGGQYVYTHDEAGNLVERTDPLGQPTRYQYDGRGRVTSLTNALNQTTHLRYDGHGNLTHIVAPDQTIRSRTYDALGRLVLLTDEAGFQQHRHYDHLGQLTGVTDPDGSQQTLAYDALGNVVRATQGGQSVSFTYAGLGRLASRQQGGTRIDFAYDREERLTALRNEKGEVYQFRLDGAGQVVEEVGFDGLTRRYDRDGAGRVVLLHRPGRGPADGRTTAYTYDGVGRVTGIRYEEGPDSPGVVQSYTYDGMGALIEARANGSRVALERDAAGRVVAEVQDGQRLDSQYDALGQRTHLASSLGGRPPLRLRPDGPVAHPTPRP